MFLKNFKIFLLFFLFLVTLIITHDDNFWSCGRNEFGQLCLGDTEDRSKPQKTSFSNISKISAGCDHSLFQNDKGEIFSCYNHHGQCGLGHSIEFQMSYQASFSMHLQTLFILFVYIAIVYFLTQKEMYTLLGLIRMAALVLVTMQNGMC